MHLWPPLLCSSIQKLGRILRDTSHLLSSSILTKMHTPYESSRNFTMVAKIIITQSLCVRKFF